MMRWNERYGRYSRIWGDGPSELAVKAVGYFQDNGIETKDLTILDVACGYGRDAFYLHQRLGCGVTGIDISSKAIDMANSSLSDGRNVSVQFIRSDFMESEPANFDVLFVSNFYHLLDQQARNLFHNKVAENLGPNGLLFLSAHSARDPQLYGKGIPHPSEPDAFTHKETYRRFSSADALQRDFHFLEIKELFEHEYLEPREEGDPHHHISWILIGMRAGKW